MRAVAFVGAVFYEAQLGPAWIKIMKRKYRKTALVRHYIRIGWETND